MKRKIGMPGIASAGGGHIGSQHVTNGTGNASVGYTFIDDTFPSNFTGNIINIDVAVDVDSITSVKFITFIKNSFKYYTAHASVGVGDLTIGIHHITVILPVAIGEYLGCYAAGGSGFFRFDVAGGVAYYCAGDQSGCVNQLFSDPDTTQREMGGQGGGASAFNDDKLLTANFGLKS
jgi:hypothetical protein